MEVKGARGVPGSVVRLSPDGDFSQSTIAPDGKSVAFWGSRPGIIGRHLWVADIASRTCRRVTKEPGLNGHPTWWPDGRSLAYFSTAGASNSLTWEAANQFSPERPSANIFRINIETGDRTQLTHGDWVDERPAVSPSGNEIVFVSNRSGKLNLWALDLASSELWQVTRNSDLDYRPAFSPKGDQIAYFTRINDGSHQLAVISWPELTPIRIETGRQFLWAHGPFWCAKTNEILFHALRRGDRLPTLWLLDMDTGASRRMNLRGLKSCSHGSLDESQTTMAFDSREIVPVSEREETITSGE